MHVPVTAGRAFTDSDRDGSQEVAIVSERLAGRLFPGESPVGRRLRLAASTEWKTIVGVAAGVRHRDVQSGAGYDLYFPYRQTNLGGAYVLVRTRMNPDALGPALSSIVWGIDPNQSFFDVRSMDTRVATIMWHQRAAGWLFGAFAVLALALAATGLYAVLSYAVSQQGRELAVRMALGAGRRQVAAVVLSRIVALVTVGLAIGLIAAALVARAIGGLLYGVAASDARTFVGVPIAIATVAIVAVCVPLRRAIRVDPIAALRAE